MCKKRKFAEKNRDFILKVDKVVEEGLKENLSLLMPKFSKERLSLLMDVYSSKDRANLLKIYKMNNSKQFLSLSA